MAGVGLSSRMPRFDPGSVYGRFAVETVLLDSVSVLYYQYHSISAPHVLINKCGALVNKTNRCTEFQFY